MAVRLLPDCQINRDLHWLRVPERIAYRLAVFVYRCQHGLAPSYLSAELSRVRHGCSAPTAIFIVGSAYRTQDAAPNDWRPCVPCCGGPRPEQFVTSRHIIAISQSVQAES